jgi:hypothetical protein
MTWFCIHWSCQTNGSLRYWQCWPHSNPDGVDTIGLAQVDPKALSLYVWIYCILCWFIQDIIKVRAPSSDDSPSCRWMHQWPAKKKKLDGDPYLQATVQQWIVRFRSTRCMQNQVTSVLELTRDPFPPFWQVVVYKTLQKYNIFGINDSTTGIKEKAPADNKV